MKLWFDEDLSPTLVQVAHERGLEATCNRDRGVLGITDPQLLDLVGRDDFVLVTDNGSDFRRLFARERIHPGLIVMPGSSGRARQQELVRGIIAWIDRAAVIAGQSCADFMVNRLIEACEDGSVTASHLP